MVSSISRTASLNSWSISLASPRLSGRITISSTKRRWFNLFSSMRIPIYCLANVLNAYSRTVMKIVGDMVSPCLTPLWIFRLLVEEWCFSVVVALSYIISSYVTISIVDNLVVFSEWSAISSYQTPFGSRQISMIRGVYIQLFFLSRFSSFADNHTVLGWKPACSRGWKKSNFVSTLYSLNIWIKYSTICHKSFLFDVMFTVLFLSLAIFFYSYLLVCVSLLSCSYFPTKFVYIPPI